MPYLKRRLNKNLLYHCLHEKTHEQQRFTILEVAADWHELMVPWRGMQPSIACNSGQLDPQHSTIAPISRTRPSTRNYRLLLINRPSRDGKLSWHRYTAAMGEIWTCDVMIASPALYHMASSAPFMTSWCQVQHSTTWPPVHQSCTTNALHSTDWEK